MRHVIKLSNGRVLGVVEGDCELSITQIDSDDTDWFLATITPDGVMVYPNSGGGCEYIVEGLIKDTEE